MSDYLKNPLSLFDVKGKVAVITGASGAFGALAAQILANAGCKLVLTAGKKADLDAITKDCIAAGAEVEALKAGGRTKDKPAKSAEAAKSAKAGKAGKDKKSEKLGKKHKAEKKQVKKADSSPTKTAKAAPAKPEPMKIVSSEPTPLPPPARIVSG